LRARQQSLTRFFTPLLALVLAHGSWAQPVANIIIGGGMQSCTSSNGGVNCTRDDWTDILRGDPALRAIRPEQLLTERQQPASVVRYRVSPAALERVAALPEMLLPAALKVALLERLKLAPLELLELQALEGLAWPNGLPEPIPRAALLHALAEPGDALPRKLQARSIAMLSNVATRTIYREMVDAARVRSSGQRPRIGIITAAARHPFEDHDIYLHAFASAGAEPVWLPLDGALRRALDGDLCAQLPALYNGVANTGAGAPPMWHPERVFPELAAQQRAACEVPEAKLHAQLRSLHGLFISGGDQGRLLDALMRRDAAGRFSQASPELDILRRAHASGRLVVAGSSAGNSAQSGGLWRGRPVPMIAGGDSARVLQDGFRPGSGPVAEAQARGGISYAEGGLGFFQFGSLDSHFAERGREARLARHVLDHQMDYGFGVDENTALIVHRRARDGSTRMRVTGAGGVFIVDARAAQREPGDPWRARGLRVNRLLPGDEARIDARGALSVRMAVGVAALPALADSSVVQQAGVERRLGFVKLVQQMASQQASAAVGLTQSAGVSPYRLQLTRDARSEIQQRQGDAFSYRDLRLDISP